MICCHLVNKTTLVQIKKDGFLKPKTRLFLISNIEKMHEEQGMTDKEHKEVKDFAIKLSRNKFIVAIPRDKINEWTKVGLINEIKYFLKPDYKLEFETPKKCEIYLREHIYQSPKEINKKFNKEMYKDIPTIDRTRIWIEYFKSTKKMKNKSDFEGIKVPELWLGCRVPINKIRIIKLR